MNQPAEVPAAFAVYSDAAKRMSAEMNMHALAGFAGHWACFKMADGSPVDHVPYPSRLEAVRFMKWDRDEICYLEIYPDGMQEKEAEAWIKWTRFLHDQGWRLPTPDFDYDGGMPDMKRDRAAMARHLISGGQK